MYYVSNPIRYKFGEEEEKGYGILVTNSYGHCYKFIPITSFRYDTIAIRDLGLTDPDAIINHINNLQTNGIDHIRLVCTGLDPIVTNAVSQYYNRSDGIKVEKEKASKSTDSPAVDTTQEILDKYKDLGFLLDPNINEYEKLSRFINYNLGGEFITVDELRAILTK